MNAESNFDVIIAGAGLAGLSLAWYLIQEKYSGEILIADVSFEPKNDKTWSFWTTGTPPFQQLLQKSWNRAQISVLDFKATLPLNEYGYYSLKSEDFHTFVLAELKNQKNITFLETTISEISTKGKHPFLRTDDGSVFSTQYIFQSVFKPDMLSASDIKYPLIQHFLGWEIETAKPAFQPDIFTMMDFDEHFSPGVAFMYVLPFSLKKALFEYTVFSDSLLEKSVYENNVRAYLQEHYQLVEGDYRIIRKEYGEIPMEIWPKLSLSDSQIIHLGAAGGQTKPSTGYTFMRIQKRTQQLARQLAEGKSLSSPRNSASNFKYYDTLLLHILSTSTEDSLRVFHSLFKNNSLDDVLRFLAEESHFGQDLKIMSSVPYRPFLKAIWKTTFSS